MKYKITCKNCGQADVIQIENGTVVIWGKNTYIISARKRLDLEWGWQCVCGNNDLLTKQEDRTIKDKVSPDPQDINQVLKHLEPEKSKFVMEKA